jgi:hypothetical protein
MSASDRVRIYREIERLTLEQARIYDELAGLYGELTKTYETAAQS